MRAKIFLASLILLIGCNLGWLGFLLFGDFAGNTKILYVSKLEILNLEKERIKSTTDKEQSLFFGKVNEALQLMQTLAKAYEDRNTRVIFVSDEFVSGKSVTSISKEVHGKVISKLSYRLKNTQTVDEVAK